MTTASEQLSSPPPRMRCRKIRQDDLPRLFRVLTQGFPDRSGKRWRCALDRLWEHAAGLPDPDCGFLLEADEVLVGVLLLVYGRGMSSGVRCNLSSWYVQSGSAAYAPFLVAQATKRRELTYSNISPAPHTLPIVEAQGFSRYADGRALTLLWCARPVPGAKVRLFKPAAAEAFPTDESEMMTRHAGYGCLAIQVDVPGGSLPFLFRAGRLRGGIPVATLVYCRDMADLVRLAGPLGRFLLLRGMPLVAVEAEAPVAGLSGWFRSGRAPRYCKGPTTPRTGDLTDTEFALFGF